MAALASAPMPQSLPSSANRTARYAFAALLVSNLFLALGPWMVRLSGVGPVAAGFWRLAIAIPFLLILLQWRRGDGGLVASQSIFVTIIIGGIFFAADLAAWHYSITQTKLANATLFGNSSSFLFAAYGFLIARTLPRGLQALALLIALIGCGLLLGSSYELSPSYLKGDLFAILGGSFYTFYLVAVDKARKNMAPMPVLILSTIAGAPFLLLFSALLGERIIPADWTALLLLSLGSQVIGQGLLVFAMGHLSPLVVGLGLLTQPAVTAVVGWLAYDERLSVTDFLGALLICAALVLIRLPSRLARSGDEPHLKEDRRAA